LLCCSSSSFSSCCTSLDISQNTAFSTNFTMLSAAQHIVPLHACSLARQPCPAALPGSLACLAALHGSLTQQFDQFRPDLIRALTRSAVTALYYMWQVTKLHARAAVLTGLSLFLVQFHHAFIICMRALIISDRF
jgi:hypothetical protein